ncbi:hypothetical protein EU538_11235 [Candidatus Thorarchaeota archaeon]|nr:MAG: hypothetical protein EU538_11235 [Candidatus Thorarchaeota archaeon]
MGGGIGIPIVRLDRGWETTPRKYEGEFIQYAYNIRLENVTPIDFDPRGFVETTDKLYNKDAEFQFKFNRAVRWYIDGLLTPDPIDRYLKFWIGLKVLHGGQTGEIRHCVIELQKKEILPETTNLFRQMYRLRCKIAHGGGKLGSVYADAKNRAPLAKRTLALEIARSLRLSGSPKELELSVSNSLALNLRLEGVIRSQNQDLSIEGPHPPFYSYNESEGYVLVRGDDELRFKCASGIVPQAGGGLTLELKRMNVVGDDGVQAGQEIQIESAPVGQPDS